MKQSVMAYFRVTKMCESESTSFLARQVNPGTPSRLCRYGRKTVHLERQGLYLSCQT